MNTPTHFLMTAALHQALPRVPIVTSAFLLGSVAPDLPLWLLSVGGGLYLHYGLGWDMATTAHFMFDDLYFYNPVWLASHNFLHAPLLLILGLTIVWRSRCHIGSSQRWLFWFFLACLLHSVVDIFTHVDDGPLLFFPFNWTFRFRSAISYWDDRYHGQTVQQIEQLMDLGFLIYLLVPRIYRYLRNLKLG